MLNNASTLMLNRHALGGYEILDIDPRLADNVFEPPGLRKVLRLKPVRAIGVLNPLSSSAFLSFESYPCGLMGNVVL